MNTMSACSTVRSNVAVGQHQWYQFGGFRCTTHFRTYFSGDWDVRWGYGVLTHSHVFEWIRLLNSNAGFVCQAMQKLRRPPAKSGKEKGLG